MFLVVLEFEPGASCLLSRSTTAWAMPHFFFFFLVIFRVESWFLAWDWPQTMILLHMTSSIDGISLTVLFARLAWNFKDAGLCLPSSWDCRSEPSQLAHLRSIHYSNRLGKKTLMTWIKIYQSHNSHTIGHLKKDIPGFGGITQHARGSGLNS
jgi:hypothetical protein